MQVAKVSFWGKDGLGTAEYSYSCEGFESGLSKGDWVIATSARSKYNIGVFIGYEVLAGEDNIAIVTQRIAGTTALKEKGETK